MFRTIIITLAAALMCGSAAFAGNTAAEKRAWDYAGDKDDGELQKTLANELL